MINNYYYYHYNYHYHYFYYYFYYYLYYYLLLLTTTTTTTIIVIVKEKEPLCYKIETVDIKQDKIISETDTVSLLTKTLTIERNDIY